VRENNHGDRPCTRAHNDRAAKTPAEAIHLTRIWPTRRSNWVRQQKARCLTNRLHDFAPGATPRKSVPKEWIDKYKGKFATAGIGKNVRSLWRAEGTEVSSARCGVTPRHAEIRLGRTWISAHNALEREMECTGVLEHTDHMVGG